MLQSYRHQQALLNRFGSLINLISSVAKVRYIEEKQDWTLLLEVALDVKCKVDDLFVCGIGMSREQLIKFHS